MKKVVGVALLCIVIGMGIIVVVFATGTIKASDIADRFSVSVIKDDKGKIIMGIGGKVVDHTTDETAKLTTSISKLDVRTNIANITLRRAEDEEAPAVHYKKAYDSKEELIYEVIVTEQDGTLTITDRLPHTLSSRGRVKGFDIEVVLAKETQLSGALSNQFGGATIKGLKVSDFNVSVDFGDVAIQETEVVGGTFDIDKGEAKISDSNLENITFILDMGSIKATNSNVDTGKWTVNMGDVKWVGGDIVSVDAKLDMGNLELNGQVMGDNTFNLSKGNLTFNTSLPRDQYVVDVDSNMSEISFKGGSQENTTPLGDHMIHLKMSMGNAELNFSTVQ